MTGTIVGIDVGLDGAFAFCRDGHWTLLDMPTVGDKRREINYAAVCASLRQQAPIAHAFIEHAGSMPKQGVASMFGFGSTYGALKMALVARGIPYTIITPQTWKKAAGIPAGAGKEASRRRALQLFPDQAASLSRKKDHARAEAMLIAYFGSAMRAIPAVRPTRRCIDE
jgi:crossover junction endodeoxyribonuclease RuvC